MLSVAPSPSGSNKAVLCSSSETYWQCVLIHHRRRRPQRSCLRSAKERMMLHRLQLQDCNFSFCGVNRRRLPSKKNHNVKPHEGYWFEEASACKKTHLLERSGSGLPCSIQYSPIAAIRSLQAGKANRNKQLGPKIGTLRRCRVLDWQEPAVQPLLLWSLESALVARWQCSEITSLV